MRESIGSTFVFGLVICFTLIFSGFLVLALNYSRAYKIKNEITSIIERYEGITSKSIIGKEQNHDKEDTGGSISIINNYLKNNNYKATGLCQPNGHTYGVKDLEVPSFEEAQKGQKYYYCLEYKPDYSHCSGMFKVTVFFDFNLPIIGHLQQFKVSGQTNEMFPVYINSVNQTDDEHCK